MYRRPPARPEAEDPPWFGSAETVNTTGEMPPVKAPDYGPATPSGSSRISFGFTAGPISPVRHPASPTSPAAPSFPAASAAPPPTAPAPAAQSWPVPTGMDSPDLPVRRVSTDTGEHRRVPDSRVADHRVPDVAEPRHFESTFETTDEQRRFESTGEQRRVADTGEFRRFLDATESQPNISDTAERRQPAPPARAATIPDPPRQSRAVTVGIVLLSLFVLVAGGVIGVVYFTGSDDKLDSVLQLGAGDSARRVVTAPLDNRDVASFEMLAATNRVTITIGELGDDLYRISTPEDAGIMPSPEIRNDDVKLNVTKDGDGTGGEVNVVLAAKVRWALRFSGYSEEQVIDLSGGQVSGIEMVGGTRTAQITLARPSGTVPIKVNGAVEKLVVKSPTGNPVRVKVGGGAKTVVAGSRTLKDVAPGSTLTPKNWAVPNRYDMGAGAPITTLSVLNS